MKILLTAAVVAGLALNVRAQEKPPDKPAETAPAPRPTAAGSDTLARSRPPVEIILAPAQASATPFRKAISYANGGAIEVKQVDPTTVVITMSGLCATNADLVCKSVATYCFDLVQEFEVKFNSEKVKGAHLTMEAQVMGILRSDHSHYTCHVFDIGGVAETREAAAVLSCSSEALMSIALPGRATAKRQDLSVYNHDGPFCIPALPGLYSLHQTWGFGTYHAPFFVRGASAEFSPQPQFFLEPYWFQNIKPFNGIATNDFGYKVTIKLIAE